MKNSIYEEVIEAKYVNFIEKGGGRVVPISYKWSKSEIKEVMSKINGILFSGGDTELRIFEDGIAVEKTAFLEKSKIVYDAAIEMNKKGIYFPVWGTCLGFEIMVLLDSKDLNFLKRCYYEKYDTHYIINYDEYRKSKLLKAFDKNQINLLETQDIMYSNHNFMIDIDKFATNKNMKYRILAYSPLPDNSINYISLLEHKKYPFYASQLHPERLVNDPKTEELYNLGITFAEFFVNECKKNDNSFENYTEENENLIPNIGQAYVHPVKGVFYLF